MKKPTLKRLGLGLVQQMAAMFIWVAIAGIVFNSYLSVESMKGTQTYYLSPLDTDPEFENSGVFREIFKTAVSDITRLVVIKGQVETNGEFDPDKRIDVTQFAKRRGQDSDCRVTAVYELEDLIKWGKYGVEYNNRSMSMSEFVNYFGPATSTANFALDENGQVYFAGFLDEEFVPEKGNNKFQISQLREENIVNSNADIPKNLEKEVERYTAEQQALEKELQRYTEEQLEDMAFSYIMAETTEEISVSREDDGTLTVYFPLLNCRYETIDNEKQLIDYAGNWVEYAKLQQNLADAITTLTTGYQQYQICNDMYLEERSNLKYVVRMMTEDGIVRTYTNVSDMKGASESDITSFFSEYRRYLIYYPDSLEFTGNTSMTEEEIYQYMSEYEYAYPETTHIWIGVDTSYSIVGDAFYNANVVFQRIVPNIGFIIIACVLLALLWLGCGIYLTATAGVAFDENGEYVLYLNGIDHIWTELMMALACALTYGGYLGYHKLLTIADMVFVSNAGMAGETLTSVYQYGAFAAYGFLASLFLNMMWYSLVRRVKLRNLWRDSFLHWLLDSFKRGVRFVVTHQNTAVSTLIPYNFFLLANLFGILVAYANRQKGYLCLFISLGVVVLDSVIGVAIFKHKAEQIDIVEGIKRIRNGEVEYKLDAEALHGDNKEMADAVNNIGEGIRKAVRTSMKDEQMKTDLITNVSHDIKTPLTSIINYVDLLKRLKIEEEPAKSYIAVLDTKSQRLKQLTDDLVEASKISSGNIVLNWEMLNLTELLNQAIGEFLDKMEERKLQVVFESSNVPAIIYADSRRMWRIIENLFNNICKYAMEGTRVYVDSMIKDGYIEVSVKNISERQMNIHTEDLTERFIRGDSSRTTEGSGLGLYIAKSLTQVQKGEFEIRLDGDLFKVVLRFPEYVEGM